MFSTKHSSLLSVILIGLIAIVLATGQSGTPDRVQAQGSLPDYCFVHGDVGNTLNWVNRINGSQQGLFPTNLTGIRDSIETLEMNNAANRLFTVNDGGVNNGQFGEMAFSSPYPGGTFSPPATIGTGNFILIGVIPDGNNPDHPLGTQSIHDVDSMSMHPWTDQLWGITQGWQDNLLFRLNPDATSSSEVLVRDTFGPGRDYVEVDLTPANFLDCTTGLPVCGNAPLPACPDAIDDLGIDPATGEFFAIANDITNLTVDWAVRINIDGINPAASPGLQSNGSISVCAVGLLRLADNTPVTDVEGFAFYNDGTFYGTTGDNSILTNQRNRLWVIDPLTGISTEIAHMNELGGTNADFEGVACLTGGGNTMDGTVFRDNNSNALFDAGDVGQPGVDVLLYMDLDNSGSRTPGDILIQTKQTDANGYYSFVVGIDGPFFIEIDTADIPTGNSLTTDNQEEADFVGYGNNDPNNNFGFASTQFGSIGDFVWNDLNGDGLQTAGEPGLSGVTVNLYSSTGVLVATTTTDANGNYSFANVAPGDYELEFIPPSGFAITAAQNAGADDAVDSDADPATRRTAVFTLGSGENTTTWDAGMTATALGSIGDFVWQDLNGNGIQDSGEPGLDGVTVNLLDGTGALVSTTTSSAGGAYNFSGLAAGDYRLQFVAPGGYTFSPQNQGGNDAVDSDPDAAGQTGLITLAAGQNTTIWDAGLVPTGIASVGDFVWNDTNGDGIQDPGEPGLAGATVNLYNNAGTLVATTTTGSTGAYSFNVPPGSYRLQFVPPAGFSFSPQDQGGDNAADSDVSPATGFTGLFTLASGDNDTTWDAGMIGVPPPLATIGQMVWDDLNGNGIQDPGEPGLANVRINLYSSTGALMGTALTNSTGSYLFTNVPPGSYRLQAIPPSGFGISPMDQGGDDTLDSDFDPATGFTISFTVAGGDTTLIWDLGLIGGAVAPAAALPAASTVLNLPFPVQLPATGYAPAAAPFRAGGWLFVVGGLAILGLGVVSLRRRS